MIPAKRRCGFTLVELMITVAIIALLATVAVPLAQTAVQRNKEQELRNGLRTLREAIDRYKELRDAGKFGPIVATETGYPKSLESLVAGMPDKSDPKEEKKIYILRRLPRDPFADPALAAEKTWGLRSYQSPPDDPQPGDDIYDVYSLSPGTGLNGVPYKDW